MLIRDSSRDLMLNDVMTYSPVVTGWQAITVRDE
jgi:hypothetical protein